MHLTNLSWTPSRPCMLLRWPNVTVLVDCPLDFSSLNHFLPYVYAQLSSSPKYPQLFPGDVMKYLKRIRENVYVEGVPELHPTPLETLDMTTVDCILVSNYNSLVALPYYTHNTGFRGSIYATEPTVQFGKLMMVELIEFFDRISLEDIDTRWKNVEVYGEFENVPLRNPSEWKKFYTKGVMEEALDGITSIAFRQTVSIVGHMTVTAYTSGHQIGSTNWIIEMDDTKLGYIGTSGARTSHTRLVDWDKMKELDTVVMTSLSTVSDNDPMSSMVAIRDVVTATLKRGGNVLLPVNPVGLIYDLIDFVVQCIDVTTGISLDTPIYLISPVAKSALAYSNVNAEWLCVDRQNMVYVPEEPFKHQAHVRSGRIRVYETLYDSFSKDYKTPCVMFCGHPSLRIGDAPHMLQMWGGDNRNALIMTNPDHPLNEVYGPFEGLSIRAFYYPIDTRLDFTQLNNTILRELSPKMLYVPDAYLSPMTPGRPDQMIIYPNSTPLRYDESLLISSKRVKKRKIKFHPDVIKKMDAKSHSTATEFGICPISGYLSVYDDAYELLPAKKRVGPLRPRYTGKLTAEQVVTALEKRDLVARVEKSEDGTSKVVVDSISAVVTLNEDGQRTVVHAPVEHRGLLVDAVTSYLQAFC